MSVRLFWRIGHEITGHYLSQSVNLGYRKFRCFFGISPQVCSLVWELLKPKLCSGAQPKHLLWSLLFLRQYNAELTNRILVGADEKTFRKWTWYFIKLLSKLDVVIKASIINDFFFKFQTFIDRLG